MYKALLVILSFFCTQVSGQAIYEDTSAPIDTILIKNVDVISPVSQKYQVGSKTQSFTPMQRKSIEQGNLSELISRYAPVYIKTDAGGLASFQFRGTNSNHTSVFVGGIDINSLTLGSANANNVPTYLFDNVDLMFGSSSATNGSGSIGGSVRLGLLPQWTKGTNGEVKVSAGSFGEYMTGAKVYAGNEKFESVTRVYYYQKENNFTFYNKESSSSIDFENFSYQKDKQRFAAIENKHLIQQFNYKWNEKQQINSFFWLADNMHEAQPNVDTNTSDTLTARPIEDHNFRSWIKYQNNLTPFLLNIGAGYVYDNNIDNGNTEDKISTQRFIAEAEINKNKGSFRYTLGGKYKYIAPTVYAYDENITEQHLDVYASMLYQITTHLKTTLNLRQQFVSRYDAPFTPALGLEYNIWHTKTHLFKISGNIQKFYRIPTFNDRYWSQTGYEGNKNIVPESGISYEAGLKHIFSFNNLSINSSLQYFNMDVDNWIMWVQGPVRWEAQNLLRVVSQGIEFHTDFALEAGKSQWSGAINYTFNSAVRKKSTNPNLIDRQIEYTPKHLANAYVAYTYKRSGISADASFVGKRYYAETEQMLDAYFLLNTSLFHNFSIAQQQFRIDAQLNNILSEQYQNQYRYAMPEINYRLALKYNF